ncbi:hypothetical protein B0J12DRAFT_698128 [Macrophomina phaseolina]|uniref:Uncharacterized protein n=1 Tax=Macrophomina phaseolina TaxID=35725 RepID=A0ABQ8GFU9_9PEZI|nr:hypothetical protein B0J12DRAFT_698128 [Macrophomina phaseolina]
MTNWEGNPNLCLDLGLCMATSDGWTGFTWEKGCRDAAGEDAAYPKLCERGQHFFRCCTCYTTLNHLAFCGPNWSLANVLQRMPGSWCCRESIDSPNYCDNLTTMTNATGIGTTVFPTQTGNSTSNKESSHAATFGGVLGAPLFVSWIALAVAVYLWRKNKTPNGGEYTHGFLDLAEADWQRPRTLRITGVMFYH